MKESVSLKEQNSAEEGLNVEKGGIVCHKCLHNFILLQVLFLNTRLHTNKEQNTRSDRFHLLNQVII